ncbi:MAG: cytochrome c peroxidase, partial [Cycloclasticus sp.]
MKNKLFYCLLISLLSSVSFAEKMNTGAPLLHGAGDDKTGYETKEYKTNSKALTTRVGQKANLIALVKQPPLGLPAVPVPSNNPITVEKIELGRKLFYDRRLSLNNTFSCAMCHVAEQGFSHNELATAVGIEGRSGRRNSPTLFNVAYAEKLFHDGREDS